MEPCIPILHYSTPLYSITPYHTGELMHRHFEDEIAELRAELLYMASLVEKAVEFSIHALTHRDAVLAQRVIDADPQIDELEVKIDNACVELIARLQPMAGDLRFIAAAMRINIYL